MDEDLEEEELLYILYGGHTSMGKSAREFFRSNGVQVVKKYHYCETTPGLTTMYEPRNFVDELTFLRNTDTVYRYSLGNIQAGFSQENIIEAVTGNSDYLLTLSTDRIEIIRNLKETYRKNVTVIFSYTDDTTLRTYFTSLGLSQKEVELRCSIGKTVKECVRRNPELFDYTIMYGGENSIFDNEYIVSQCQVLYAKSQVQKNDDQSELLNYVIEIRNTVREMDSTLKRLCRFIEDDLQEQLKKEKHAYESVYGFADNEAGIAALADNVTRYISNYVLRTDFNDLLKKEDSDLRLLFGDVWDKLLPGTKTTLLSANVLWQNCPSQNTIFDYSGICLTVTSALENELKYWFFTGFQEYLIKRYGHPSTLLDVFKVWPEELLDTKYYSYKNAKLKPTVNCGDLFTLGKLPFLFYNEKSRVTRKRMKEYLDTIFKDEYRNNKGGTIGAIDWIDFKKQGEVNTWERDPHSFISGCENIRNDYRNPAAHSGIVCRDDAEICYQRVIGRTDAYRHCSEVQGLIMTLYDYLNV